MKSSSSPTDSRPKLTPLQVYESTSTSRRSPRLAPPNNNVPSKPPKSSKPKTTHISLRRSPRLEPAPATVQSVSRKKHIRNVSKTKCSARNVSVDLKIPSRSSRAGNSRMQNVAANRTVLVDSSALRRSPRLSSVDMEIVVSERNAPGVLADTARLRRSPRLANGYAEVAVGKVRTFLKRKRVSDEMSRSPRNQNGRLDVQFALVQSEKCSRFIVNEENERNCLEVECSSKEITKGSPVACGSANAKLGCCQKRGCQSVLLTISDSEVGDSGEFEAKPLLLPWHEDNERQTGMVKCDDGSSVFGEEPLRMSPSFDFANENAVINESPIKSCKWSSALDGDGNFEVISCSSGIFNSNDVCPSKRVKICEENSASGMSDEKLLRRSPRTNSIVVTESREKKSGKKQSPKKNSGKERSLEKASSGKKQKEHRGNCSLIGDPIPHDEAQERWYWRYEMKSKRTKHSRLALDDDDEDKVVWNVECHYTQADIEGRIINLGDCVYVKGEGAKNHIGSILEFFKTTDREDYFRVQWFYRAEDTVMKEAADFHDNKRLFYSTVMNDNPIDCIISTVTVVQISPRVDLKFHSTLASDFYFDMEYCVDYSTFRTLLTDCSLKGHELSPLPFCDSRSATPSDISMENMSTCGSYKAKLTLLDLFSGCGGMSTGLCLGAKVSCVDLVTRWALDSDESACQSLKLNHPETHVRNEAAEDFLELLKEWQKLCKRYVVNDVGRTHNSRSMASSMSKQNKNSSNDDDIAPGEYEVARLVDICYGKTDKRGKRGLKFKVHWKGYSTSEDSWEPIEGLSNCGDCIRDFVREGFKSKILPLPGDADVICGGPPCQGISGYNRYRNVDSPLADERNIQIVVFMDIVQFLKPKYVLMENVVDILRFDKASFARYALSRLVHMKYQARLGTVAAGCYGLPQFRLRVFLWGAHPKEKLPQFPLPSHDVIVRYWPPPEFERNTVAYDEDQPRDDLEKATVLRDAISDLPDVTSHETREKMAYDKPPETDFQQFIRSTRNEMTGSELSGTRMINLLYDHRPYSLTEEDFARVCQIPKKKGANFRDLPGVVVGADNVARRGPMKEQMLLPSGKPLVPDFALNFEGGKSRRPYARLWWDETVSTVVTFPDLHSQSKIEFSPYENVQGCKVFLIIIGSTGQLNKGIVKLEMQLQFL
ncbi:PREDICTED: DNA (cytosine-5)-methyltransferase CMT2 isoform X2 [Populus euphratica]|uniref:DNA (cytosine-5-)-methyltransferase n=1 Tax=Populus euphratica TaxID=75702 RepID=A0AAJ6UFB1_POPEU|nr:PREDICTED: DNA (cytosine-5)-methyltransferase CMT2 isoform X2 [Populus euphratica]